MQIGAKKKRNKHINKNSFIFENSLECIEYRFEAFSMLQYLNKNLSVFLHACNSNLIRSQFYIEQKVYFWCCCFSIIKMPMQNDSLGKSL